MDRNFPWHRGAFGLVTAIAGGWVFLSGASVAQTSPNPAPAAAADPPVVQQNDPNKPLSEKLKESEGVLKPNSNMDKEMQITPPPTDSKMPVIPPPGNPGGDQRVQPK
jgi:hypothetical protein